jgi:hypothetical protein
MTRSQATGTRTTGTQTTGTKTTGTQTSGTRNSGTKTTEARSTTSEPPATSLQPLRVVPAPSHRPPVIPETELWQPEPADSPAYIQDALAVDFDAVSDEVLFGARPTRRSDLPDPRPWAGHIAQAIVEVMAGARPAPQLLRWTTPEVYDVVAHRAYVSSRRGLPATRRATVRSIRVCEPADGVAEASAVVLDGGRVRALAMRLVGIDGRWRVEALQIG